MATAGKNLSAFIPHEYSAHFRVGIVVSTWNEQITHALRDVALEVLAASDIAREQILVHSVPGTYELASGAQWLLRSGKVDGVIAIGCVVRGETAHFDYVCQAATAGLQRVSLDFEKPVMFCVLTDDNIEQSRARAGGVHGNKGIEAGDALLTMLELRDRLLS